MIAAAEEWRTTVGQLPEVKERAATRLTIYRGTPDAPFGLPSFP